MASPNDRILIVTADPLIADLLSRQALQAAGYQCHVVSDVNSAINKSIQFAPDAIIADIKIPGLNAKDLLVALSGQSVQIPMIVLAHKGMEADIIQTFRLGASDFLIWPVRETEVVNAVERTLKQVHERRERERLSQQLTHTNQELQQRVRELTTIYSLGKVVTSTTDPGVLFKKVLSGAMRVTHADLGWLLIKDDTTRNFILSATQNVPDSLNAEINQPWDDGIGSLVSMSGEVLSIFGEPIKRFKIAALGQSALVVPIKVQKQVIGLLTVMRKKAIAFTTSEQNLLEAVVDFAAISLVNARQFRALQERALSLETLVENAQSGEKVNNGLILALKKELRPPLQNAHALLKALTKGPSVRWTADQRRLLTGLQDEIQYMDLITEAINPLHLTQSKTGAAQAPVAQVSEVMQQVAQRFKPLALKNSVTVVIELPAQPLCAQGDPDQVAQILQGLLSNAIRYSKPGGSVVLRAEKAPNRLVHISVTDFGSGLDAAAAARIFEESGAAPAGQRRFGGLAIGLPLVKELVERQRGTIWVESKPEHGAVIHVTLNDIDKPS